MEDGGNFLPGYCPAVRRRMRLLGLPEGGAKLRRQRTPDSSECCQISERTTFVGALEALARRSATVIALSLFDCQRPLIGLAGRILPQSHALKRKQRNKRAASAIPIGKGSAQLARLGQVPQGGPPRRQSARRGRRSARSVAQLAKLGQIPPVAGPPERRSDRRRHRSTRGV